MKRGATAQEIASRAPVTTGSEVALDRFHLAVLTFLRAKQLVGGARPRVDGADGHKASRIALLEVMAGQVSWDIPVDGEAQPAESARSGSGGGRP